MAATIITQSDLALQLWGGLEGTVNRVHDQYFSQLERNGHASRSGDLEHFASLGIRALRYPVLWERTAPDGLDTADWSWPDQRLAALRRLGVRPIVGLTHHGSGPRHTSLVDPDFAAQLADYAGAVARRYPWIDDYTPVNEPLTTARFSGLYGHWYPHGRDDATFLRALVNQCRAVVLSMRAIRQVNPRARLIQTEDLGKTYGTDAMREQAGFNNARRWLSWDLLCGRVDSGHELWHYLTGNGITDDELAWFREHPCPPDVIGINYYITSERWLDHRVHLYPGQPAPDGYVDVEAVRTMATPPPGVALLLREAWQRYGLPLAVTEAHIDANREDQLRWLKQAWQAAAQARSEGVDVRAVTVWALLGAFDWNSLVTRDHGYYESGAYDVRSGRLRPTALVPMMRELANGRTPSHPVLSGQGWWNRPQRLLYPPAGPAPDHPPPAEEPSQPILIVGDDVDGALGNALADACAGRNLACLRLDPAQADAGDGHALNEVIARHRPWAVIYAVAPYGGVAGSQAGDDIAGIGDVDDIAGIADVPTRAVGLAIACARHGMKLLCLSGTQLFDGAGDGAWLESATPAPVTAHGRRMADTEARVAALCGDALLVRTGPWFDQDPGLQALASRCAALPGEAGDAPGVHLDAQVLASSCYLPDVADACLNLLIDRESGVWHLHHGAPVSDLELARRLCHAARPGMASTPVSDLVPAPLANRGQPRVRALGSARGVMLSSLDSALQRWCQGRHQAAITPGAGSPR